MKLHPVPRGKRRPLTDSHVQLQHLGLKAIDATTFQSDRWLVHRAESDPDYPWRLKDLEKGTSRHLASLVEAVEVLRAAAVAVLKKASGAQTALCDYCGGTGEVPESSTRYMPCPKCCRRGGSHGSL